MLDPAEARALYRLQYRMTRKKAHGAKAAPVEYARFAARSGFFIAYGQHHGMPYERVWRGIDTWQPHAPPPQSA